MMLEVGICYKGRFECNQLGSQDDFIVLKSFR